VAAVEPLPADPADDPPPDEPPPDPPELVAVPFSTAVSWSSAAVTLSSA
jgi:hypothetical protein